jgi:type II secretory pathway pseudopilin PulG
VSLLELMIVMALLALVAGVTGVAFTRARPVAAVAASIAVVAAARDSALRSGRVVTLRTSALGSRLSAELTAYPDGRVIADSSLGIDPLTGRPTHAQ